MLKPIYITFQGDLYHITADILGDVKEITVYRDNRNSPGEPLEYEDLPPEVIEKLTVALNKLWKEL